MILCCYCYTLDALEEKNEDLQDAQRPVGVSLREAECYQSFKQMAFHLRGFVLLRYAKVTFQR